MVNQTIWEMKIAQKCCQMANGMINPAVHKEGSSVKRVSVNHASMGSDKCYTHKDCNFRMDENVPFHVISGSKLMPHFARFQTIFFFFVTFRSRW